MDTRILQNRKIEFRTAVSEDFIFNDMCYSECSSTRSFEESLASRVSPESISTFI